MGNCITWHENCIEIWETSDPFNRCDTIISSHSKWYNEIFQLVSHVKNVPRDVAGMVYFILHFRWCTNVHTIAHKQLNLATWPHLKIDQVQLSVAHCKSWYASSWIIHCHTQWEKTGICTIDYKNITAPTRSLTVTDYIWPWPSIPRELRSWSIYRWKVKVKGHSVHRIEWKRMDGWKEPSSLMRLVMIRSLNITHFHTVTSAFGASPIN